MSAQAFLARLGGQLRLLREQRGLPLAELARRAGVSRRYLTEAEGGRANLSVEVLLRVAEALGERPERLVALAAEARVERVALVGLRGAGKTTVGRLLAQELESPFVELDQRVEELAGLSLAELFALHGSEGFRRHEAEALERVLAEGGRLVLATGGSIVEDAPTFERLRATCRTVWLAAEPEEHLARVRAQGDHRPMHARPRALDELRTLLAARAPLYSRCEFRVTTSAKPPAAIAAEIVALLARA
jgi:XRE family aerobic/anaerobic benzoate catabolism transcriptional regulator